MDDQTAYWLLSSLLQAMATIWGLVMIFYLFLIDRLMENTKVLAKDILKKDVESISLERNIKYSIKNTSSSRLFMIFFNITIAVSIISSILGLIYFRNDFLINLSIIASIISIIILCGYLIFYVLLMSQANITVLELFQLQTEKKKKKT